MRELTLRFEGGELTEVYFSDRISGDVRRSIRGKSGGAYRTDGSFQWTSAVRGLSLLIVRSVCRIDEPVLKGGAGTVAASLDYAISKEPIWLKEMFGCDRSGRCLIRKIVLRTNPERKRPGPTVLSINERFLSLNSIAVISEGVRCSTEALLALADSFSQGDASGILRPAA